MCVVSRALKDPMELLVTLDQSVKLEILDLLAHKDRKDLR